MALTFGVTWMPTLNRRCQSFVEKLFDTFGLLFRASLPAGIAAVGKFIVDDELIDYAQRESPDDLLQVQAILCQARGDRHLDGGPR